MTLKVLIGAVPTCMILSGLCILMASPTPKVTSQNSFRRLSLQRWAPHARGYTLQGNTNIHGCEIYRPAGAPEACTQLSTLPLQTRHLASVTPSFLDFLQLLRSSLLYLSPSITSQRVVWKHSLLGPCPLSSPRCRAPRPLA